MILNSTNGMRISPNSNHEDTIKPRIKDAGLSLRNLVEDAYKNSSSKSLRDGVEQMVNNAIAKGYTYDEVVQNKSFMKNLEVMLHMSAKDGDIKAKSSLNYLNGIKTLTLPDAQYEAQMAKERFESHNSYKVDPELVIKADRRTGKEYAVFKDGTYMPRQEYLDSLYDDVEPDFSRNEDKIKVVDVPAGNSLNKDCIANATTAQ